MISKTGGKVNNTNLGGDIKFPCVHNFFYQHKPFNTFLVCTKFSNSANPMLLKFCSLVTMAFCAANTPYVVSLKPSILCASGSMEISTFLFQCIINMTPVNIQPAGMCIQFYYYIIGSTGINDFFMINRITFPAQ